MLQSTTTRTITTTIVTTAARLRGAQYQARAAQAEALKSVILAAGTTEPGRPCRLVSVEGQPAFGEVVAHPAGCVVRFFVAGPGSIKRRELVILPTQERGYDVWLSVDGKLFPHQGKYRVAADALLGTIVHDMS